MNTMNMLIKVAGSLLDRGICAARVVGTRIYVGEACVAYLHSKRGTIVVPARLVFDGHTFVEAGGLGNAEFSTATLAALPRIRGAITDRALAYAAALRLCPHRDDKSGVCPECGATIPVAPAGVDAALESAASEMYRRGLRGTFRCGAVGPTLRVTWHQNQGSRTRDMESALHCAAEHLRAAGLNADAMPGLDCIYLSPIAAAEEKTCLDSVRVEDPVAAE